MLPFRGVGSGDRNSSGQSICFFSLLEQLAGDTPSTWLLAVLGKNYNYTTNLAQVGSHVEGFKPEYVKRGFPVLQQLGLVKRMGRGIYMLNPFIFIPPPESLKALQKAWEQLP